MQKIRVAIVGVGRWGPVLINNFLKINQVEVCRICDLDQNKLKQIKLLHPKIQTTNNFQNLLKDKQIDLVALATPLDSHFDLASQVLKANKHVFIEKPFVNSLAEAIKLIKLAKANNLVLMVGHTSLYNKAFSEIKTMIRSNVLGKIFYYNSTRANTTDTGIDKNVMWDLASHDLSILNFLIPHPPISVKAVSSCPNGKFKFSIVHLFIKYLNNFTAHIEVSTISPLKTRLIALGGDKKSLVYDEIENCNLIKIYASQKTASATPYQEIFLKNNDILYNELTHLVDCLKTKKTPLTDGSEGGKVIKLLQAFDQALSSQKEVHIA